MVNWQEADKMRPLPHPHAVRLLRGLVWEQHYRDSNPQCEGGMPGSFELREDMGADRLQAVEDWLRVEGYAYRFCQKCCRVWTRPDRPGKGLRPDGIDEDEKPQRVPVGRHDERLYMGHDRKEVPGTGERAHAAGQQQQRVPGEGEAICQGQEAGQEMAGVPGIPGRRSPPKPRRTIPGTGPQPPAPNGPVAVTTRSHHPWRLPRSRQEGQDQATSAAPEEVRPQQRRGVGSLGEDAGRPGQLQEQRRFRPKGRGPRLRARLWGALQPSGCLATGHAAERCREGRRQDPPGGGHRFGERHGLPRLDRGGHCGRSHSCSRPGGSDCPGQG